MNTDSTQRKLVAKMIYTHFSVGQHVSDTQWAEPLSPGKYRIHGIDTKPVDMMVGQAWGEAHELSVNEDGRAMLGQWVLPTGRNLLMGLTAKPKGNADNPSGYIIRNRGGEAITITKGVPHRTYGEVSVDEFGNLSTQAGAILLTKKAFEISLLVFSERIDGGYLAYVNRLEPGNKANRKDGTKGVFYPPRSSNQPAKFWEQIAADSKVNTAVIWPSKSGSSYCTIETRSPDAAAEIDRADREILRYKAMAETLGIDPATIQYHQNAVRESATAKREVVKYPFRIIAGANILFAPGQSRTRSP